MASTPVMTAQATPLSRFDVTGGRADTTMGRYLFQREAAFIKRFLDAAIQPHALLEVGCGKGQITQLLQSRVHRVVGLEVDPQLLPICQAVTKTSGLVQGRVPLLPFADGSFDCIIAMECVGFFAHQPFLQECKRVLSPGGLLIFDSVNARSYRWFLRQLFGRSVTRRLKRFLDRAGGINSVDHPKSSAGAYQLSYPEVRQAVTEQGFNIEAVSGYNWIPFDVRSDSALVYPAMLLEELLQLAEYPNRSPWFLIAASKRATIGA